MNRLITSVLVGLVGLNAVLQADPTKPKLVVGIMVDQLRTDYIDYLRDLFGERGLKLLADSGLNLRNVDFGVAGLNGGVATAEVMSGAYPRTNGVTSVLTATGQLSPDQLTVTTIADELAIDGGGMANVYAIAPDRATAVALGGHAANSVIWLDPNSGQWTTDSYYGPLPQTAALRNGRQAVAARIDTMVWKPVLPIDRYPGVAPKKKFYPFRYTFPTSDRDVYRRFARTPLMNREVTDLAIDFINGLKLGNRGSDATDMIGIGLTAAPYKEASDGNYRLELADSYIRLDGQIERLLNAIDSTVGLDHTVVFLSSTGYCDEAVPEDPQFRIPGGELSLKRMKSLLNSYLTAKYGNGDFVEKIEDNVLTLNYKTIDEKHLDLNEVLTASRSFLNRMSGVDRVFTFDEILSGNTPEARALQLSTDPHTAPDLTIDYQSGWTVIDDLKYPVTEKVVRSSAVATPAFILAPALEAETINTPVDATALAATVSGILRIRSPNASRQPIR